VDKQGYEDRAKENMTRLKELNRRLRTASGLVELENVPAYQRRAITLEEPPHSSQSQVSKYSLDETGNDGERKTQIGSNNSFLHDNVD
jgi:cell division protein FtsZ